MKLLGLAQYAAVSAAVVAAGCSTGGQQSSFAPTAPIPQRVATSVHAEKIGQGKSWMSPDAKKVPLLYVTDGGNYEMYVYSYPGGMLEGTVSGINTPSGLCVDKKGNVFVTAYNGDEILEYAHGGTTPIATLADPAGQPAACSIDPLTGNLAVANEYNASGGYGNVAIYKHGKGLPAFTYTPGEQGSYPPLTGASNLGYDAQGNLFVNGAGRYYGQNAMGEIVNKGLPKKRKFTFLTLNQAISSPGAIQWDGSYITMADQGANPNVVYQISVSGSNATVVGTTTLSGATPIRRRYGVAGYWIDQASGTLVGPSIAGFIGLWNYPAGGTATSTISENQPAFAAVSNPSTASNP